MRLHPTGQPGWSGQLTPELRRHARGTGTLLWTHAVEGRRVRRMPRPRWFQGQAPQLRHVQGPRDLLKQDPYARASRR